MFRKLKGSALVFLFWPMMVGYLVHEFVYAYEYVYETRNLLTKAVSEYVSFLVSFFAMVAWLLLLLAIVARIV